MPSKGTTPRNVRIPDGVWTAAKVKAEAKGTTVSAVIQEYLRKWVERP